MRETSLRYGAGLPTTVVDKKDKYIKNDNDIITIIAGFKAILALCMNFEEPHEFESTPDGADQATGVVVEETVTYDGWYDWYYDQGNVHVEVKYPVKRYDLV